MIDTIQVHRGGPPLHLHFEQDEVFFVLEGQFRFRIGDDIHEAGSDDILFGPPIKIVHSRKG